MFASFAYLRYDYVSCALSSSDLLRPGWNHHHSQLPQHLSSRHLHFLFYSTLLYILTLHFVGDTSLVDPVTVSNPMPHLMCRRAGRRASSWCRLSNLWPRCRERMADVCGVRVHRLRRRGCATGRVETVFAMAA